MEVPFLIPLKLLYLEKMTGRNLLNEYDHRPALSAITERLIVLFT
ncbi:hypothetical protein [Bacillus atrophaeus]